MDEIHYDNVPTSEDKKITDRSIFRSGLMEGFSAFYEDVKMYVGEAIQDGQGRPVRPKRDVTGENSDAR